ncbi:MAG: dUTP diphosphatase [Enterobacteriaceae bacterium]
MEKIIKIKILNKKIKKKLIPKYQTSGAAGLDLRACIDEEIELKPKKDVIIKSGISIYIKNKNIAAILIPRSGLSIKHGIILKNSIGLIDSDYQGEIIISLFNNSKNSYFIKPIERIAQIVFIPIIKIKFDFVKEFSLSKRGEKGFGHSGRN